MTDPDDLEELIRLRQQQPDFAGAIDSAQLPDTEAIVSSVGGAPPAPPPPPPAPSRAPMAATEVPMELPQWSAPVDDGSVDAAMDADRTSQAIRGIHHAGNLLTAGTSGANRPVADMYQGQAPTNFAEAARRQLAAKAGQSYDSKLKAFDSQTRRMAATKPSGVPEEDRKRALDLREQQIEQSKRGLDSRIDLGEKRLSFSQSEAVRKTAAGKAAMERKQAAAQKGATDKLNSSKVGYLGRVLVPKSGVPLDPARLHDLTKKAAASGTVVSSLREMQGLLERLVKDPTNLALRGQVESQAGLLAPRINVAQGQGAMAEGEYTRVKQSVGDITSTQFWIDAIRGKDDPGLVARTRQAVKYFVNDMAREAEAAQMVFEGE